MKATGRDKFGREDAAHKLAEPKGGKALLPPKLVLRDFQGGPFVPGSGAIHEQMWGGEKSHMEITTRLL